MGFPNSVEERPDPQHNEEGDGEEDRQADDRNLLLCGYGTDSVEFLSTCDCDVVVVVESEEYLQRTISPCGDR